MNIHRRQLTGTQRAVIAKKMATMKHGGDRKSDQSAILRFDQKSLSDAGKIMSVSKRMVDHDRRAKRDGTQKSSPPGRGGP